LSSLVSIIITAYNQDKFLSEAIESVLNQTYTNLECIIIDDGSIDQTKSICEKYLSQDKRIKYFFQLNKGVAIARNKGFELSSGTFIQFLDGDDFLLPDKLRIQVGFMEDHDDVGVSYTNHFHYWNNTKQFASYDFENLSENPLDQFLYKHDEGVSLPIHAALIRKDIWSIGETPFPSDFPYRYEDWVFWVKICLKNIKFYFLNERLVAYRMHEENFVADPLSIVLNAIKATLYISNLISSDSRQLFTENKITQILLKYQKTIALNENNNSSIKNKLAQMFKKNLKYFNKKK
jgi:glycosyltransferase involved in cell wall biosynthesis